MGCHPTLPESPTRHLRWLRRHLVHHVPAAYWNTQLSRRALTVIVKAMAAFLAAHLDILLRRPVEVSDDGDTRRVVVLGAFIYAFSRRQRIAWAEIANGRGDWEILGPDSKSLIAFGSPLYTPRWREPVWMGLEACASDWLRRAAAECFPAIDEGAFEELMWRVWRRAWPRAHVARTLRSIATPELRRKIQSELALDPHLLALVRACSLRSHPVCQDRLTFVWQHVDTLCRVRAQTPQLLAPVAEFLFRFGVDGHQDPTRRFKLWLRRCGIKGGAFRLLARQGARPFDAVIRRWNFDSSLDALVLALRLAQRPNGVCPLPATLSNALLDAYEDATSPSQWLDRLQHLPPRFLDVAQRAAERACGSCPLDQFLRDEFGLVLNWYLDSPNAIAPLARESWQCWLNAARQHRERKRAAFGGPGWSSVIESWRTPTASATALISPLMLFDEASAMHHCIHQHAKRCAAGDQRVFGARMRCGGREVRATIAIEPGQQGWEVVDVRGTCNRPMGSAWWRFARALAREYARVALSPASQAMRCRTLPINLLPSTAAKPGDFNEPFRP